MDKTDSTILSILKENSRASASDISKQVSLSVPAVTERIRKLEQTGVIEKYTIRVNPGASGYNLLACKNGLFQEYGGFSGCVPSASPGAGMPSYRGACGFSPEGAFPGYAGYRGFSVLYAEGYQGCDRCQYYQLPVYVKGRNYSLGWEKGQAFILRQFLFIDRIICLDSAETLCDSVIF